MTVKDAITELCKIFKLGKSSIQITPEDFRLAKIDNNKSMPIMMKLLLMLLSHIDSSCQLNKNNLKHLKSVLLKVKYPRVGALFDDDDKTLSNREILFCVSYCLSCSKYLVTTVKEAMVAVDPYTMLYSKQNDANNQSNLNYFKTLQVEDQINFVTISINKLQRLYDRLLNLQTEIKMMQTKIDDKVVSSGKFTSSSFTSAHHVLLIKYPCLTNQVINELKRKSQILKSYVKWKEQENYFWTWLSNSLSEASRLEIEQQQQEEDELMKCTQVPLMRSCISSFHSNFSQLVKTLKEKQQIVESTRSNQQSKKVGIEEELAIKKEVDQMFCGINDVHLQPTLVFTGNCEETSQKTLKYSVPLTDVKQKLSSIRQSLQSVSQEELIMNESVLLEMLSSTRLSDYAVVMPVKPTNN